MSNLNNKSTRQDHIETASDYIKDAKKHCLSSHLEEIPKHLHTGLEKFDRFNKDAQEIIASTLKDFKSTAHTAKVFLQRTIDGLSPGGRGR